MSAITPRASTIMIIRHAEKPPEPPIQSPPFGVTPSGEQDIHSLIVRGWQRAGALVTFFASAQPAAHALGISTPNFVFAFKTDADTEHPHNATGAPIGSKGKRAQQTVAPLVEKLSDQVTLNVTFDEGDEVAMSAAAMACDGVVLICWEHHAIPIIASQFPVKQGTSVPQTWPADTQGIARFDLVWVFTYDQAAGVYQFSQVPQLLLAGDSPI